MEFRKLFADERTTKNIVRSHGAIFNSNQYIRKKQTSDSIYCAPTIGRRRNRIILHITWPAFPRRDLKSKRIKRSLVIKNQTEIVLTFWKNGVLASGLLLGFDETVEIRPEKACWHFEFIEVPESLTECHLWCPILILQIRLENIKTKNIQ